MKLMAKRIQEMRTSHGMTQEELGEKLGVLRQTISSWESGNVANIKRSSIQKMAEIFKCDPVWLMGFEDAPEVTVTYESPDRETIKAIVDHQPIIGKSAEMAKRTELYQAVLEVRPENYDIAIKLRRSLS